MIPQSFGFVTVPSPGTPVKLSATPLQAQGVQIDPRSAPGTLNVGNVYIGNSTMNKATGVGVCKVLGPEQVQPLPLFPSTDLAQVYVDADIAGDGVLVSYLT